MVHHAAHLRVASTMRRKRFLGVSCVVRSDSSNPKSPPPQMSRQRHRQVRRSASCLAAVLALGFAAFLLNSADAATIYWDGTHSNDNTNGWNATASWSTASGATTPDPTAVPGIGDDVVFNISTVNTAQIVDLNGGGNSNSQSANSLLFRSTGTVLIQEGGDSAGHTFTIGGGGLTINSGAGAVTIGGTAANGKQNVGIIINANQNWAN
jgi:hypothetical protein